MLAAARRAVQRNLIGVRRRIPKHQTAAADGDMSVTFILPGETLLFPPGSQRKSLRDIAQPPITSGIL
ncbi:hypothetical protein DICSQDRAFT_137623 [Dichomitus squalens LYAD-421 SS1]|uniref:Uncharacterized protein n=1 Tax=Dichomitus squalens (strain LYAD-421) TaxID=732165 RepID=R7SX64_DICSQ|nr:uncharacterized protein DICSQDRAFT_137623 [Dichomitus squalens LYAD-421 SS1]EJF60315.1 hypothetical protein DICSQDRAFT_137623 [Dichomitus squalens LYAD-421 SS1]